METKEVARLKEEVEKQVTILLKSLQEQTGCESLDVDFVEIENVENRKRYKIIVSTKITLSF